MNTTVAAPPRKLFLPFRMIRGFWRALDFSRRVVFNLIFLVLFRTRGVWDVNGKPKGLTRAAYEALDLKSDDWFIDAELVLSARRRGLVVAELPVVFHRNEERASFVQPRAIVEFAGNMAREWFRRRT